MTQATMQIAVDRAARTFVLLAAGGTLGFIAGIYWVMWMFKDLI